MVQGITIHFGIGYQMSSRGEGVCAKTIHEVIDVGAGVGRAIVMFGGAMSVTMTIDGEAACVPPRLDDG
jgi:hypothetical protein